MATIGVKVELEGAQAYKQNMSQVTAETKLYQAEVKRLGEEIKQGSNVFKNHIEQGKALEKQLASQKEQEKLLKDEIARVSAEQGENSAQVLKLKTQYENLQTAIAKTEASLKENGGTWGALSASLEGISEKLGGLGDKMTAFGGTLSKTVTAPIVAIGAASMKAFGEVDDALDIVRTKTGATGEAFENMQGIVEDIATSIPTSFEKAASAVGEVNTRFGSTGEELNELSTQFVKFAEINGVDVSNSIDSVQKALSSYGLEAKDATALLDRMNKVGQDTGVAVDKLASGIVSNGTAFQEMGLSIDEAVTFMGQLEKSGANSETVLNGMRKALKAATADGKPLSEALTELQNTIENGTGSVDGLTAAYEVFGKSGDQIYGAVQNGTINFKDLVASMQDASGSVSDTFASTIDPVDELQMHMNELKLLGTDIANQVMPFIKQGMEKLGEVIKKISDAWNGLSEEQQQMIVKIAGIAAVVGPLIVVLGSVVGAISSIVGAVGGLIAVVGPFLPLIVGVGAAIAAVIIIMKNMDEITAYLREHFGLLGDIIATQFENIKIVIMAFVEAAKVIFETFLEVAKALFSGDFEKIGQILANAWIKINKIFSDAISKVIKNITDLGSRIFDKFKEIADGALNWGKDLIQNFIDGILAKWNALKDTVSRVAQTVKDYIGFSEPSKGPLSGPQGFHTFAPDMMELFAKGIKDNEKLISDQLSASFDLRSIIANPNNYLNNNSQVLDLLNNIYGLLPDVGGQQIVLDTGILVGETVGKMDAALGQLYINNQRSV